MLVERLDAGRLQLGNGLLRDGVLLRRSVQDVVERLLPLRVVRFDAAHQIGARVRIGVKLGQLRQKPWLIQIILCYLKR